MRIKICDQIMGAGKTQAAIARMNEDTESKYLFITPYLDECDRIIKSCKQRNFVQPKRTSETKSINIREMIKVGKNIASTHQLFRHFDNEVAAEIKKQHYKLVLDEAFHILDVLNASEEDISIAVESGLLNMQPDGSVILAKDDYQGDVFQEVAEFARSGNVFHYEGRLYYWIFPKSVLEAFDEIIVLTYFFEAQQLKYYFDMVGMEYEYIGVRRDGDDFRFCSYLESDTNTCDFRDKIHILEDKKLNSIGDDKFALSKNWYAKSKTSEKNKQAYKQMKNNISNVFKNKFDSSSGSRMWTTFKDYYGGLRGKGYTKAFIPCNARATNEYRDRTHLAYMINIFLTPTVTIWFHQHGITVDQETYALSEMLQWIWRSAIRDGKEIWIYVPSQRMRKLLEDWINAESPRSCEELNATHEPPTDPNPARAAIMAHQEKIRMKMKEISKMIDEAAEVDMGPSCFID